MTKHSTGRVALVWRGTREARGKGAAELGRMGPTFEALRAAGLAPEPAVYLDEMVDEVRAQLLQVDGVLVWVNPLTEEGDRSTLDAMLREVATRGVWVSTHPDVILKMGTKEVLVTTKELGWGSDCHVYRSVAQMRAELPARLTSGATRVLKQYRGNGGNGVYRVALRNAHEPGAANAFIGPDSLVTTQHALAGSVPKDMRLNEFMMLLEKHFEAEGRIIDQPYQARLADGMIRCYMVQGEVVGFGHQRIKALLPLPLEGPDSPDARPGPRIMHGAEASEFQALRHKLEAEWIPAMQKLLDIPSRQLPAVWDADFLYGPKTTSGQDSYVLCEINVSCVFPFPDQVLPKLASATALAIASASAERRA